MRTATQREYYEAIALYEKGGQWAVSEYAVKQRYYFMGCHAL